MLSAVFLRKKWISEITIKAQGPRDPAVWGSNKHCLNRKVGASWKMRKLRVEIFSFTLTYNSFQSEFWMFQVEMFPKINVK